MENKCRISSNTIMLLRKFRFFICKVPEIQNVSKFFVDNFYMVRWCWQNRLRKCIFKTFSLLCLSKKKRKSFKNTFSYTFLSAHSNHIQIIEKKMWWNFEFPVPLTFTATWSLTNRKRIFLINNSPNFCSCPIINDHQA
jgi:hypothetical protein